MDTTRRQFLKVILIGSGTFVMGKLLSPLLSGSSHAALPLRPASPFRVADNERFLSIYDATGEEVLQIDHLS